MVESWIECLAERLKNLLSEESLIGELVHEKLLGCQNEQPDDKAFPSGALLLQLVDECFLVLTVFRPNILLLSGVLLGLHELHDDLVDLLLHAVEPDDLSLIHI